MTPVDLFSAVLLLGGAAFFLAGTIGVLRFPDVFSRLHALTKADNAGLFLIVLGLGVRAGSWLVMGKLLMIWMLVLLAGATASHLVARSTLRRGVEPWTRS